MDGFEGDGELGFDVGLSGVVGESAVGVGSLWVKGVGDEQEGVPEIEMGMGAMAQELDWRGGVE